MRRALVAICLSALIFTLAGCAGQGVESTAAPEQGYFDSAVANSFTPGVTTQEEILSKLGEPYPDPLKSPERWTYQYTMKKQVVFTFKDKVLTARHWTTQYGI